jgi:hypothetical protein
MPQASRIRFAAGQPTAPFSGVWRLIVNKDHVYLGPSKEAMRVFKISLHKSGVWVLAATQQSGGSFQDGNRRAKQWRSPAPHVAGVTRGPSIFVPHTSLGSRPLSPNEDAEKVVWFPAPENGQLVEFGLYFVDDGVATLWNAEESVLAELRLASGRRIIVIASVRMSPASFLATVEGMLNKTIVRMKDPSGYLGGSYLWVTQSRDALTIPIIVDLPVNIGPENPMPPD